MILIPVEPFDIGVVVYSFGNANLRLSLLLYKSRSRKEFSYNVLVGDCSGALLANQIMFNIIIN